jgi:hypothetical protein
MGEKLIFALLSLDIFEAILCERVTSLFEGFSESNCNKSPGIVQIPAELIKAEGSNICCEIHKLIIPIWNKEELPD